MVIGRHVSRMRPDRWCAILVTGLVLAACSVQLAPDYEQPIVDGLNDFNAAILTHMASVSDGTEPGLNAEAQKVYDSLEGQGMALMMLIEARPTPKPAIARLFGASRADDIPPDGEGGGLDVLDAPTDDQVAQILGQLDRMENEDRDQGLASGQYKLYANAIESFMRNALTYELALKR